MKTIKNKGALRRIVLWLNLVVGIFLIGCENRFSYPAVTSAEKELTIELSDGVSMTFVYIPAGNFRLGSPPQEKDRDNNEGPTRQVQITKSFYMSKYEVTQDQYMAVTRENTSNFAGGKLPVDSITWDEAATFCEAIGSNFRLPTEAEWEYACRAGTETRFYYGDDPGYSQLGQYAWYSENSNQGTQIVGLKKPNAWGLYDMHGNVCEWCSDWYEDSYEYTFSMNPKGPLAGEYHVARGGSWYNNAENCRSANRLSSLGTPDHRYSYIGFRVVLDKE